ncbi:STAS domain-containing protein [Streptomyces lunaelactis]|uniref:STAS domain-containing protein n=1 Tax=Streptomyces lunaelactis TaxID=1535768 RepID=UPI0015847211|nr:STAS domain-containing protein [Streptomyces lunaelactis]NUK07975.1 STAS domain-containing protein [Streptomyces lunaelactis]NUL11618.1 STAS domain-containing protein [Streptomyces lunaelactis]NUL24224.1 STAS domain-containing protein [Streptomyces lunaelactis]
MDATESIVVRIAGNVTSADVPRLCDELCVQLMDTDATEAICDVGELGRPDLAAVNAVARLQLTARRMGCRILLRNAAPELRALLDLVGLGEAARPIAPARAGPGAGRDPSPD